MTYKDVEKWQEIPTLHRLSDLKKPPNNLYLSDPTNFDIFENCIAIVGSRRMTDYGKQAIEKLVPQLVMEKKTIISGFMYGVDQYAHQICLDCGGKTIAVLGWGITTPLEGYDKKLAQEIISSGSILLSEWEDQQPTLWTFPIRNRIVAALSTDVYVIEAAPKSGSLLTAELAIGLRRTVWAVPGPITSRTSAGTNMLISEGKAKPWLGTVPKDTKESSDPLIQIIENEALSASELSRKLNQPIAAIGSQLSLLSLTGQITEREGKYYAH